MRLLPSFALVSLVAGLASVVACSGGDESSEPGRSDAVVGGKLESAYAATGYLVTGDDYATLSGPNCGATLIGTRYAVTAAHCIYEKQMQRYGVAFGEVATALKVPALAAYMHPLYDPKATERYRHDVALIVLLNEVTTIQPAVIAKASTAVPGRYIGYGRTTVGGYDASGGYTNERKSAAQSITQVDALSIFAKGIDGGLCWGDSGGPLMREGTNEILGVLADFDKAFDCSSSNAMIFASLDADLDFLDSAKTCKLGPLVGPLPKGCPIVLTARDAGAADASDAGDAGDASDASDASDAANEGGKGDGGGTGGGDGGGKGDAASDADVDAATGTTTGTTIPTPGTGTTSKPSTQDDDEEDEEEETVEFVDAGSSGPVYLGPATPPRVACSAAPVGSNGTDGTFAIPMFLGIFALVLRPLRRRR